MGIGRGKSTVREFLEKATREKFHEKMTEGTEEMSKITFFLEGKGEWKPEQTAEYMNKLTRKQASIIFKTRTRMLKVKANYKNGFPDQTCRACKAANETQKHVLEECTALHPYGQSSRSKPIDPFSNNINDMKTTVKHIEDITETLNEVSI